MIKWLEKTLGQELKTPKDFLFVLLFFAVLLPIFIYSVGLALWFFFYIVGYHAFFLTTVEQLSGIAKGEIPFADLYSLFWSSLVRDVQDFRLVSIFTIPISLFMLAVVVITNGFVIFLIIMIIRGIIRALWRLTNKIVKRTTR